MYVDLARIHPTDLAVVLGSRLSVDLTAPEQVDAEVKAAGRRALNLVASDGPEIGDAVAGLLQELPSCGVLDALVPLDVPAGQKPRARERTGGLLDDQDTAGAVEARDDGADARPLPRQGPLPMRPCLWAPSATRSRASWWASA